MRYDDDRLPVLIHLHKQVHDLDSSLAVKLACRLISKEQCRFR